MDGEITKCPYNTIYAPLKNKKPEGGVLCCVHGANCVYSNHNNTKKSDENQYVNLGSPKKEDPIASKLVEKLNKLVVEEKVPTRPKVETMSLYTLMEKESTRKGKSEKEKKKKKEPTEQSESYVMLGPTSEGQTSTVLSTSAPASEISIIDRQDDSDRRGEASSAYIGVLTLAEAENRLTNRGEFALYHLSHPAGRLDTLYESLPLMLIYRTTTKKNRHYSIRVSSENQYFVDCGYPNVRKHYSLNQLVMYYKVSATCEINPDDTSADSFSWWLE
ncbi:hypothetical protein GCK72_000940 [Caenorhabditis remanei]|uniref:SH2 domain-containing protein n=1 Tax=Caenorhabditis remanei TaxID=31234 RepID=A0A6A5HR21_CAERE|nr:hypothetical protein GCK72_000940 [Caenorhabditis remanei]KAF1769126.1 hypothetical protein GCK72_000940 [Caenorhabditis remanei]